MKSYFKPVLLEIGGGEGPVVGGETGLGIPDDIILGPTRSLTNPVEQISVETMNVLGEVDAVESSGPDEIVEFNASAVPEMDINLTEPLP